METLAEMKAMVGTIGTQDLIYVPSDRTMYKPWEFEDMIKEYSEIKPRLAKKLEASSIKVKSVWTWKLQDAIFEPCGWCLVRTNEVYINQADGSIISSL